MQAGWVRDIFPSPYRPKRIDRTWFAWGGAAATAIASEADAREDFSALPILADALQDAGCEDHDVLAHCRDAGRVHVRGCWVVDLVLGRE